VATKGTKDLSATETTKDTKGTAVRRPAVGGTGTASPFVVFVFLVARAVGAWI
jgi:hypothetical protein